MFGKSKRTKTVLSNSTDTNFKYDVETIGEFDDTGEPIGWHFTGNNNGLVMSGGVMTHYVNDVKHWCGHTLEELKEIYNEAKESD